MNSIEVKTFTPAPGGEWVASSYPGPGIYRCMMSGFDNLMIVFNNAVTSVIGAGYMVSETESLEAVSIGGISENCLLRALAIVQKPELALQLMGGAA